MKKTTKAQKNMDIIAMLKGEPVTHGTTVAEAIEHLEHENALLSKKSSGERKPSAKQTENAKLSTIVLEWMKEQTEPKTVTDMMKAIPELEGMSNQKASSLVKPLKDAGLLKKEIIKGRSFFSVSAD
jgi:hypothetical protein